MKRQKIRNIVMVTVLMGLALAGMVLGNVMNQRNTQADTISSGQGEKARSGILTMSGALSQTKVHSMGDGLFGLSICLTAGEVPVMGDTPKPVDMVIVLDRSGSMAGPKIEDARAAVADLISGLSKNDRIALVSYSGDVTIHAGLTTADSSRRSMLESTVRSISAGGGTNLSGGLDAGMRIMAQDKEREGRLGKVILISDGHANHGITEPSELGRMARAAHNDGYSITTVGLGVDYNEQLMATVADEGGGNYYFMENPAAFAEVFRKELKLTRAVAAGGVEIRIPLLEGMEVAHAAGFPIIVENGAAVFRPGPVRSGQTREFFITMRVPTGSEGEYILKDVSAAFEEEGEKKQVVLGNALVVTAVADEQEALNSLDTVLWEKQVLQEEYGRLKEQVANDVMNGDEEAAMAKIGQYESKQRMYNASAGSAKVEQNLAVELEQLEEDVRTSLAPSAAPAEQNRAAKAMQSEAYDARRSKTK